MARGHLGLRRARGGRAGGSAAAEDSAALECVLDWELCAAIASQETGDRRLHRAKGQLGTTV